MRCALPIVVCQPVVYGFADFKVVRARFFIIKDETSIQGDLIKVA